MQTQYGADIALAYFLLVIGIAQEGQSHTVSTQRRLNDIRDILFVGFGIEVFTALARVGLMLGQVEVGAVRNAPEFAPAEGEQELDVGGGIGVV